MTRTIARLSAALLTAALLTLAGPASAHVGVSSTDAAQDGFGKAVFRVPNESDTATTTKVVVTLPAKTPFAFLSAGSKPGWSVDVAKTTLDKPAKVGDFNLTEVVSTVTWTAKGDGVPVGQFDEFAISAGPFPDADTMSFSVQQTYSDGEVVDWSQPQTGDKEPEHPAPVLKLTAADESAHATSADADEPGDSDETQLGTWLGGAALVLAAAALLVSLRQNRRRA